MRFLLVDRILELESGKRATGIKNVTLSEDFFTHHFPERPIMPGVLMTETLVQLADWLIREKTDFLQIGFPVNFERLRFRRLVRPGDQLHMEVEVLSWEGAMVSVKGKIACEGSAVASVQFTMELHPSEAFHAPHEARRLYQMIKV